MTPRGGKCRGEDEFHTRKATGWAKRFLCFHSREQLEDLRSNLLEGQRYGSYPERSISSYLLLPRWHIEGNKVFYEGSGGSEDALVLARPRKQFENKDDLDYLPARRRQFLHDSIEVEARGFLPDRIFLETVEPLSDYGLSGHNEEGPIRHPAAIFK